MTKKSGDRAPLWTTRGVVRWMTEDFSRRGLTSPRLDAELLVAHALGVGRVQLYLDLDRPVDERERARVRQLVERRRKREPVAYILGEKEFFGLPFQVSDAVLIPRPETELIVELALKHFSEENSGTLLDVGTGSGAIALSVAHHRPLLRTLATDISENALAVARDNAARLNVSDRVAFHQGDLFAAVEEGAIFDAIACNPPYISRDEFANLAPDIRDHEPKAALLADDHGLAFYTRLASGLRDSLSPRGCAWFEIGAGQAEAVTALFEAAGHEVTAVHKDLASIPRVVEVRLV